LPHTGGDSQETIDLLLSAQAKLKTLLDSEPGRADYRFNFGRTFHKLAAQYARNEPEKCESCYRVAIAEYDRALSSGGELNLNFTIRVSLRYSLWGLSERILKRGETDEAIALGRRAIDVEKWLIQERPTTGALRSSAGPRGRFLKLLRDNGHADEADAIAETLGPSIP
jgi:hypothetical protein